MDDNIFSVQLASVAIVIKRRTLLYSLIVLVVCLLTFYVARKEINHIDESLTWQKFIDDFGTNYKGNNLKSYLNKVVKWQGTVLRIDSEF